MRQKSYYYFCHTAGLKIFDGLPIILGNIKKYVFLPSLKFWVYRSHIELVLPFSEVFNSSVFVGFPAHLEHMAIPPPVPAVVTTIDVTRKEKMLNVFVVHISTVLN